MKKTIMRLIVFICCCASIISQDKLEKEMSNIFPYVVTKNYPIDVQSGKSTPIGNDIYIEYVIEKKGIVEGINISITKNKEKIKVKAIENLQKVFKNDIKAMSFQNGPGNCMFILIGNHWSAATQIINPDLFLWATKILKTDKLIISIPNRETLLIFPNMDKIFYSDIKKMVIEKESNDRKMLTFELFLLTSSGLKQL
jgi:hypothetical protein